MGQAAQFPRPAPSTPSPSTPINQIAALGPAPDRRCARCAASHQKEKTMITEQDSCAQQARTQTIAALNDALRKHAEGGFIVVTRGVRALPRFDALELLALLAAYDGFDEDNNPYGERDFGDLSFRGADLLWKIDYYDADMLDGSPDPADRSCTCRVLTLMLANEW
jgi:hypothetical protein